jgi:hypothetical protein
VRNGLLLVAIALALALVTPAAHASVAPGPTGRIVLGPLAVLNPAEVDVPYTLEGFDSGVAKLGLEVKVPSQPDFEFLGYYENPKPSDTLHVFWRRFDGGDLRVRLTAVDAAGNVLAVAETVTTVEAESLLVSLTPPFGDVELGATGESKRIRIEGQGLAPLRIRSFKVSGDEFKLLSEDCIGRPVGFDGCYVEIAFSPAALGERTGNLEIEANAYTGSGIPLHGVGVPAVERALLVPQTSPTPVPTPSPTPTPVVDEEPELVFDSAPGPTSTRVFRLRLENLRAGSTITVRCAKGCPAKTLTKRGVSGTLSLSRFAARRLKVGTTIRVTIVAPGARPLELTLKVRAKREPSVTARVRKA